MDFVSLNHKLSVYEGFSTILSSDLQPMSRPNQQIIFHSLLELAPDGKLNNILGYPFLWGTDLIEIIPNMKPESMFI